LCARARAEGINDKEKLVQELEKYGRVLKTSKKPLPKNLEKYRISVSPEKFHDLRSYATLYVGEGGKIALEARACSENSLKY